MFSAIQHFNSRVRYRTINENNYLGVVENGNYTLLLPQSQQDQPLRFTTAGMQVAYPPEHDEIDFDAYEGKALMIRGMGNGEWIYSAEIVDVGSPIVTQLVRQLLRKKA